MGNSASRLDKIIQPLPSKYLKGAQPGIYYVFAEESTVSSEKSLTDNGLPPFQPIQETKRNTMQQQAHQNIIFCYNTALQELPQPSHPFVRNYKVLINDSDYVSYVNHLSYRNQKQFSDFLVQVPFGTLQSYQQNGYTRMSLYAEEMVLNLNQLCQVPFEEMLPIIYFSLLGYMYLYSYFGLMKIQPNMIRFNRQGNVRVWINRKLTSSTVEPYCTDINLKRFKQEQSYMVDDLSTIFWNKVDKSTVPHQFDFMNGTKVRAQRLRSSKLSLSRLFTVTKAFQIQRTLHSLEGNLVTDFSDGSFDRSLSYIQNYFGIVRPAFGKKSAKTLKNQVASVQKIVKSKDILNKTIFNVKKINNLAEISASSKQKYFQPNSQAYYQSSKQIIMSQTNSSRKIMSISQAETQHPSSNAYIVPPSLKYKYQYQQNSSVRPIPVVAFSHTPVLANSSSNLIMIKNTNQSSNYNPVISLPYHQGNNQGDSRNHSQGYIQGYNNSQICRISLPSASTIQQQMAFSNVDEIQLKENVKQIEQQGQIQNSIIQQLQLVQKLIEKSQLN